MGQPSPVAKATLTPPLIPRITADAIDDAEGDDHLMPPSPEGEEGNGDVVRSSSPQQRQQRPHGHDGGPDHPEDEDAPNSDASAQSGSDGEMSPHVRSQTHPSPAPLVGALPPASLPLDDSDGEIDQLGDENHPNAAASLHLAASRPAPSPTLSPDCEVTGANLTASASAAAAAAAASRAVPAAAVEPDDPTVPCWNRAVPSFGPFFHQVVRAGRQETTLELPNFALLGHVWHIDLYPLRPGGTVGVFLKYIDKTVSNNSFEMPNVYFRVVAFHRDVVAETDRLNVAILRQRKEAAQKAAEAEAEASGQPVGPPSAAASEAAAALFPLHAYPANDPRNAEALQDRPYRFRMGEDYGFKNWFSHKEIDDYLCGPEHTLYFRVLIQGDRQSSAAGSRVRKLSSFLTDPTAPQLQWPYLGLNNQGATCYLSSYVQTLFYLPAFRRAVYNIPVDALQMLELIEPGGVSTAGGVAAAAGGSSLAVRSPSPVAVKTSIPLALQHLFFLLQTGRKAVDTRTLTKSFGWDSADSFQQHDVQEFSRVLLDALDESVVKQQPPMPAITRLFEGKQQMYIECQNVPYASTRVESFLDLALNVKNAGTLQRSFDEYVAEELMQGSNQYRAVDKDKGIDFGMQDARKGVRFLRFPQVLQIQLKRFEYTEMGTMRKLDERLEFPTRLDLTQMEWGEEEETADGQEGAAADPAAPKKPRARKPTDPLDPAIYHLHSVLVHRGSLSGGHYFAFIRPFLGSSGAGYEDSPWLKFDDETVSICADAREATEKNFGGEYTDVFQCLGKKMTESARSNGNAYMLVYVRQKLVAAKGFSEEAHVPVPAHLSEAKQQEPEVTTPAAAVATNGVHPVSAAAALLPHQPRMNGESKEANGDVDVDGDASMLEPGAPAPAPPALVRAASHCFTATPTDLRSFIDSLAPVPVPLPPHISTGIDEARRVRREREERERELALQFRLDVVVESDLIWQGLGHGAGRGGVAGLGLTVAPAIDASDPQPLALRDFLFSKPLKPHTFKRTDTIGSVRAQLAAEAGLPLERAQLWRVHRKAQTSATGLALRRQQCDYLHDDNKQLGSLAESPLLSSQGTPLLLVRDRLAIDQDEALSKISANSGAVEGAHRTLDPALSGGAGQNERVMLIFKYFDVHSQRMVMLGSAILWKHMSVQHLKQFLMALLRSRAIDIESRTRMPAPVVVKRFEQLHRGSVAAGAPALKKEETASDVDMAPAVGSSQLPFLSHMHRLGAGMPLVCSFGAPPAPEVTADAADVVDANSDRVLSVDEQRYACWLQARLDGITAAPLTPADFVAPALHLVEEAECVATAMLEALEGTATASQTNLLKIKDAPLANIHNLQESKKTLRECGLTNGSVIIVEPQASAPELAQASSALSKQLVRCHRADGGAGASAVLSAPSTPTSSGSPLKLKSEGDQTMADSSSASSSSAAAAAAAAHPLATPTLFTSPLHFALLDPLPMHASFHPSARSYLKYLLHRWLVAFTPAVLDPATMERSPLDPVASPLHPAAALGSVVMEVSTAWTLEHMRSQLAQRVSALVTPSVRASYPQVSNAHCYKLWKPSRQFPGTIYVKDGDITRKILSGTPVTVAFALVGQPTVDGLGPLEQLVRNHSTTRSSVQTLYFELSAVSLRELEDQWWLQLELVDERGDVHRLPAANPGLWPDQPFLVPKSTDFLLRGLRQTIYDQFIVAHRASLPLAHCTLLGADGQPLPPPASAHSAMGISVKSEQPSSASKRRAEAAGASEQPASKKLKNEEAQPTPRDQVATPNSGVSAPPVPLSLNDLRLHIYVPNAAPLVVSYLNSLPQAMAHFLLPWSNWDKCSVSNAALTQLRVWFERARTDTPKGSHVRHPSIFADKDLNAMQYTQALPFRLTCYLQAAPRGADADAAWVYRFTTYSSPAAPQPLPPKQGYSFSPLPPILSFVDANAAADDPQGAAFRRRLAHQIAKRPEEMQLALLRPKHYELLPTDAAAAPAPATAVPAASSPVVESLSPPPAASHLFEEWLSDEKSSVQLGLFDGTTKHLRSTSSNQVDTAPGATFNHNAQRFNKSAAAITIRK